MAKQSPFLMKDGGHILSKYAARVGTAVDVKELRVAVSGWQSQFLVHNCASFAAVTEADLADYVADKGYAGYAVGSQIAAAVSRVLRSLQNSTPLHVEYNLVAGKWCISRAAENRPFPNALDALGAELRALRKDEGMCRYTVTGGGYNSSHSSIVPSWKTPAGAADVFEAAGVSDRGELVRELRRAPFAWFTKRLVQAGVPMELFKFSGYRRSGEDNTNQNGNQKPLSNVFVIHPGMTVLVGPADAFGIRPYWVGPRLGDVMCWVCDAYALDSGLSAAGSVKCTWKTIQPTAQTTDVPIATFTAAAPDASADATAGYAVHYRYQESAASYRVSSVSGQLPTYVTRTEYKGVPTAPSTVFDFATTGWVADACVPTNADYPDLSPLSFTSNKWWLNRPHALADWRYEVVSPVKIGDAVSGLGLDTWTINSGRVCFTTPMSAIREYLTEQSVRTDITVVDKTKLTTALTKSEPYVDALLFTTVVSTPATPASLADVKALSMVVAAAKGDVNLMTEDLGGGETLTTMGKRLDALRTKGKTFVAYTRLNDEAAVVEQLVSARVAATIVSADRWNLSATTDAISGLKGVSGSYQNGATEMLTVTEAALLLISGAVSSDGTVTDVYVATDLGLGLSWRQDLADLGSKSLIGDGSGYATVGASRLAWDKFSPRAFSDMWGYPVVGYVDKDTAVRSQLLFKAMDGDPSGLACALFFVNQISFQSAAVTP